MSDMNFDLAPGWLPPEGEVIVGKVTDVSRQRSNLNEQAYYPIITVETEGPVTVKDGDSTKVVAPGGSVAIHAFHGVLKARLIELRPTIGDRLGVKYAKASVKDKNAKGGNTPHVYVVKVEGKSVDIYAGMSHPYETDIPVQAQEFVPSAAEDDDIPF